MIMLLCILANIVIAAFAAGTCGYLFLGVDNVEELNSNLMPLLAAFVVSWFFGKLALGVWDCAATTSNSIFKYLSCYFVLSSSLPIRGGTK